MRGLFLLVLGLVLVVRVACAGQVTLTWDAPVWPAGQTPVALLSYVLERDGGEIARPLAPPYTDTAPAGTYTYAVRALYVGNQLSGPSNAVTTTVTAPLPLPAPSHFSCVFTPGLPPTFTCQAVVSGPPAGPYPLRPVGSVTVAAVDSQEIVGEDGRASNAIDGKPATIWHTQWQAAQPPLPHMLTLDLGAVMWTDALKYVPRQDGDHNGTITSYRLEGSSDTQTWTVLGSGTWALDKGEKTVRFPASAARYVRLTALVSNGTPFASAAEVGVYATE